MSSTPTPLKLRFPLSSPSVKGVGATLPSVLSRSASRSAGDGVMALLPNVTAVQTWPLVQVSRSGNAPAHDDTAADSRLLALEATDGTTIFIRADALAERVAQVRPDALDSEGVVDLARFRDTDAASRGLGDWLWKQVTELKVEPDDISKLAEEKLTDLLKDTALGKLEDGVVMAASSWGAKALMEAVEDKLAGEPGLYHWSGGALAASDRCIEGDPRLAGWADRPALVFIHGTGSHTLGSYGDLPGSEDWRDLAAVYESRVFGLEHRTFSQSPIDNALALATVLPRNCRIHLVTHSRGGLVGDLMCLSERSSPDQPFALSDLIEDFRRTPRLDEAEREAADASGAFKAAREKVSADEQAKLRQLVKLLDDKAIRIERYVRVASPAAGTALLSDNLEVFLSGPLELARRAGSWATGAAAGALVGAVSGGVGGPAAAETVRKAFDRGLKLLARVVVEIANKRLQPQLVPGIEAMLPESPMGAFLARVPRQETLKMAVIAGDIEGGGLLKRIGVAFTDWMFFDKADNDLVVDTSSMYAGVARQGAFALFEQGAEVNHFSYFRNRRSRMAMRQWLLAADPGRLEEWTEMQSLLAERAQAVSRGVSTPSADNTRPVVIYLPGIMGSRLEINRTDPAREGSGDCIWLDPIDLALGGLRKITFDKPGVAAADVVDLAYGKLARNLERTHRVIRFAYDWRLPNEQQVVRLAKVVEDALARHPNQPVRILAHSMGGLVTRCFIAQCPELWEAIVKRDGGRLVMLGTPNHGSHLMVETLLGRSDTMRMLARLDLRSGLQRVLDIVAGFPGALQLLPEPGFRDAGGRDAARDYFKADSWPPLTEVNNDFWFGRQLGGRPASANLDTARKFWAMLGAAPPVAQTERISYVFGQAVNTPCGLSEQKDASGKLIGLAMLGTPFGDGSVSWASGKLDWLPPERCWLMPVDHSGLVNSPEYFDDIDALLMTGSPKRLGRLPTARSDAAAPTREYQPGPMPGYPSEQELVAALVGGHSRPYLPKPPRARLSVLVRAGDLRFCAIPLLCGHYIGDPISGAEWVIDRELVGSALSQRERLGVHAGPLGSASVVLMPRSREELLRGTGRGALIVGLGEFGELSVGDVRETVRAGVLRLLLHSAARQTEQSELEALASHRSAPLGLRLASVLIGYNSTTHISVDESVAAVTLGVAEANRQFSEGARGRPAAQVASLEFVEQFEDVAITAARAVAALPVTQMRGFKALEIALDPARELTYGEGVRPRLSVSASSYYWPRLMVTDAERNESGCPAECYEVRVESPIPPEARAALLAAHGCDKAEGAAGTPGGLTVIGPHYPSKLRYLFLSERARAEAIVHQRQPGLIEKLVAAETSSTLHNPNVGIGRTLFHLLVPLDFKNAARESANLMLVVDAYSANLPWEMLVADGEPLVLTTRVVRQLASYRYRQQVRGTRQLSAYVIANPATEGYFAEFGGQRPLPEKGEDHLRDLTGAEEEGAAVAGLLESAGYDVMQSPGGSGAAEVIGRLYKQPYRILVVAAHGMFNVKDRQGNFRSGVVLSDGLMLTAAEIGQMEIVPELVFLSCCHLGEVNPDEGWAPNKLAYSLARELIEMGVRCVVAAGWEVEDQAAKTFSTTFFERLVRGKDCFGEALFQARRACFDLHPGLNTWGAYQAYGDPAYTLGSQPDNIGDRQPRVSPTEWVDWLNTRRLEAGRKGAEKGAYQKLNSELKHRLVDLPADWAARADVQYALGALHAAYGSDGFEPACKAYRAAIAADSNVSTAPLKAVEQLANLESRSAEKLVRSKGDANNTKANLEEAERRAQNAVATLECLLKQSGASNDLPANTERWSLLGSAYKRQVVVMVSEGKGWEDIVSLLVKAREAYRSGEGDPSAPGFDPYGMINRLHLDALLGDDVPNLSELVEQCQSVARRRFAKSFYFWDGIKPADAELARRLLLGELAKTATAGAAVNLLVDCYRKEVEKLHPEPRMFDSVVQQIQFLADLYIVRADAGLPSAPGDQQCANALLLLAAALKGQSTPGNLAPEPASPALAVNAANAKTSAAKPKKGKR